MWTFWMGFSLPLSLAFQSTWLAFNCALWSGNIRSLCVPERRLPVEPVAIERCGNIIYLPATTRVMLRGEARRGRRASAEVIDLPMRQRG